MTRRLDRRTLATDLATSGVRVLSLAGPKDETGVYANIGWHIVEAPAIWCDQPGERVKLANEVAVVLVCQGTAEWPDGEIDLCGAPW